ncbi:MAG: hypothetical protein ACOX0N_02150 [Syntrophomonadaceae bacterium]
MLIVMSIAEELEAVERERARRRMLATQNNKSGKAIAAVETFPPQELGKTRDKVAAAVILLPFLRKIEGFSPLCFFLLCCCLNPLGFLAL